MHFSISPTFARTKFCQPATSHDDLIQSPILQLQARVQAWQSASQLALDHEILTGWHALLTEDKPELVISNDTWETLPDIFDLFLSVTTLTLDLPKLTALPSTLLQSDSIRSIKLMQCVSIVSLSLRQMQNLNRIVVISSAQLLELQLPVSIAGIRIINCPKLRLPRLSDTVLTREEQNLSPGSDSTRSLLFALDNTEFLERKVSQIAFAYFRCMTKDMQFSGRVAIECLAHKSNAEVVIYRARNVSYPLPSYILKIYLSSIKAEKVAKKLALFDPFTAKERENLALACGYLDKDHCYLLSRDTAALIFEDYYFGDMAQILKVNNGLQKAHLLSLQHKKDIARELLEALIRCHQKKIVHHDIKPSNIFFKRKQSRYIAAIGDFDDLLSPDILYRKIPTLLQSTFAKNPPVIEGNFLNRLEFFNNVLIPRLSHALLFGFPHTSYFVPLNLEGFLSNLLSKSAGVLELKNAFVFDQTESVEENKGFDFSKWARETVLVSDLVQIVMQVSMLYDLSAMGLSLTCLFIEHNLLHSSAFSSNVRMQRAIHPVSQKTISSLQIHDTFYFKALFIATGLTEEQAALLHRLIMPYSTVVGSPQVQALHLYTALQENPIKPNVFDA